MEGKYFNLTKSISEKPTAIIINGERFPTFYLRSGQARISGLTTSVCILVNFLASAINKGKEIK
jgi:hypothetical protein